MKKLLSRGRCLRLVWASILVLLTACGGAETTAPIQSDELTEEQKQQVKDLDEQRQSEWGPRK